MKLNCSSENDGSSESDFKFHITLSIGSFSPAYTKQLKRFSISEVFFTLQIIHTIFQ